MSDNGITIEEKRDSCLNLMDLYISHYEKSIQINREGIKKYKEQQEEYLNGKNEGKLKIRFAFSFIFNILFAFVVPPDTVDFKLYKNYKERITRNVDEQIQKFNNFVYLIDKLAAELRECKKTLEESDETVSKLYYIVSQDGEILNSGLLVNRILQTCGHSINMELHKYPVFTENKPVTKDSTGYETQILECIGKIQARSRMAVIANKVKNLQ